MTACCLLPPHRGGSTARMTPPAQQMPIPGAARLHAVSHNSRVRACYMGSGCWAWLPQPSNLRNRSLPRCSFFQVVRSRRSDAAHTPTRRVRLAGRQEAHRLVLLASSLVAKLFAAARRPLWASSSVTEVSSSMRGPRCTYARRAAAGFFYVCSCSLLAAARPSS